MCTYTSNCPLDEGEQLDPEALENWDKNVAAAHIAGHLTVGLAFGIQGSVGLTHIGTLETQDEIAWEGEYRASGRVNSRIALGGVVAECAIPLLAELPSDHTLAETIIGWIDDERVAPSPADWKSINRETLLEDITAAVVALREHRAFFEWAFESVMTNGSITDDWRRGSSVRCMANPRPPAAVCGAAAAISSGVRRFGIKSDRDDL